MREIIPTLTQLEKIKDFSDWDWEQFVSTGIVVRELKDRAQFYLGRLALEVEKKYGKDALGRFADEIGVNKNSLKVYRWVVKNFMTEGKKVMNHNLFKTQLPFFAYQLVAGTENPREWIEKAVENDWTTTQLAIEISKAKGKKRKKKKKVKCPRCGFEFEI